MAHFVIDMIDGSVAIMETVGSITLEECIAKWHPIEQAKVVGYQAIEKADLPSDRTYRAAWKLDMTNPIKAKVVEDAVKVAEIDAAIAIEEAKL